MKNKVINIIILILLIALGILFLFPFYIIIISSFKSKIDILEYPFRMPNSLSLRYYISGIKDVNYFKAFFNTLFITISSNILIIITSSMISWAIARTYNKIIKKLYYLFLLSIVVPFQLIMYPLIYFSSNILHLDNMYGIILIYVGLGSGMSVFLFSGFIKSIPKEIEESALIDGCNSYKTFFYIIFPILKPIIVTVIILNTMWIWNDYLLPYYILPSEERTISVAINALIGSYGTVRYSEMTSLITITIIPIIIIYLLLQKYIIEGITTGSVKS